MQNTIKSPKRKIKCLKICITDVLSLIVPYIVNTKILRSKDITLPMHAT